MELRCFPSLVFSPLKRTEVVFHDGQIHASSRQLQAAWRRQAANMALVSSSLEIQVLCIVCIALSSQGGAPTPLLPLGLASYLLWPKENATSTNLQAFSQYQGLAHPFSSLVSLYQKGRLCQWKSERYGTTLAQTWPSQGHTRSHKANAHQTCEQVQPSTEGPFS